MAEKRVQRRLAAILAADVVGYSRMMGADEAGTLARLNAVRSEVLHPKVSEYGGRIVKTTGDGTLIEFPSAVDAVQHAVDVQHALAQRNAGLPDGERIEIRMGINLGDVIVQDDDVFGDGVNVAARLEGLAEPGGIVLSGSVHEQVRNRLDATFEDLGRLALKNIADAVRAYAVRTKPAGKPEAAGREALPLPDKPSVAVLPFANLSGDPDQEYFADGVAEDIITALSRFHWLFVIARNSSFAYKGHHVDVRRMGRELGVRYVLEGSVRRSGSRLRITAQLVEAGSANHLWAERYDGATADVFDLQDRITEAVVGAVAPSVREAEIERARRKRPDSLDAYDLVLRALPYVSTRLPRDATEAIPLLEEAVALDPGYGFAEAMLAWCYHQRFHRGGLDPADGSAAVAHARAAMAKGSNDAEALALSGFVIATSHEHDTETALGLLERAVALSPSSIIALSYSALVLACVGKGEEAIERAERALRLSPFDSFRVVALNALSASHFGAGRFEAAAGAARQALEANPRLSQSHALLGAALVKLGRADQARAAIARALEIEPSRTIRSTTALLSLPPEMLEPFVAALRAAGMPE